MKLLEVLLHLDQDTCSIPFTHRRSFLTMEESQWEQFDNRLVYSYIRVFAEL